MVYGLVVLDLGRVLDAARRFQKAAGELRGMHPVWSYVATVSRAVALGMAGQAESARQALTEAQAQRHPSLVFREPDWVLARAWVAAAEGAVGEARSAAREAALAAGDGDALQAASAQLGEMGAKLAAADAAAQAAAAYTRHGRKGSAQTATVRAHRLAVACGAARTPALAAMAAPPTLTSREREIVTLAAGGLSNRAIAERLVVSVRTVENHLYRAGAKLGITDRSELATLLRG